MAETNYLYERSEYFHLFQNSERTIRLAANELANRETSFAVHAMEKHKPIKP